MVLSCPPFPQRPSHLNERVLHLLCSAMLGPTMQCHAAPYCAVQCWTLQCWTLLCSAVDRAVLNRTVLDPNVQCSA